VDVCEEGITDSSHIYNNIFGISYFSRSRKMTSKNRKSEYDNDEDDNDGS
jgi:hypothetical protein